MVVNLFALRATNPKEMRSNKDPIGEDADENILEVLSIAKLAVCAWGVDGRHLGRSKQILDLLRKKGIEIFCFKKTKSGEPNHPLYLSSKILKADLIRL